MLSLAESAVAAPASSRSAGIAPRHARAEVGELVDALGRARVVRPHAGPLRREAVGQGDVEGVERGHLAIEPGLRVGPEAVRPAEAGAEMADSELAQPFHAVVEAMVL